MIFLFCFVFSKNNKLYWLMWCYSLNVIHCYPKAFKSLLTPSAPLTSPFVMHITQLNLLMLGLSIKWMAPHSPNDIKVYFSWNYLNEHCKQQFVIVHAKCYTRITELSVYQLCLCARIPLKSLPLLSIKRILCTVQ